MSDDDVFSAPDASWPGPISPIDEALFGLDTHGEVNDEVEPARAEELFVASLDDGEDLLSDTQLPKKRYADRELSWVSFNQRVLEQSEDETLPLLERAWFSAIFSSNLDEFYMVRVAGLKRRLEAGVKRAGASGLKPAKVLERVQERIRELATRQAQAFHQHILPELAQRGITLKTWDDLDFTERSYLTRFFRHRIFPVLTPLAVDPTHPFPYISGLSLNLAVVVHNPATGKKHFARVKVPQSLPRLVNIDEVSAQMSAERAAAGVEVEAASTVKRPRFITLENVIRAHLAYLFPGVDIVESCAFRITRDEDLALDEDDADNLLAAMEAELRRRKFGPVVRLEVEDTVSRSILKLLVEKLEITRDDVMALPAPLDLTLCNELHELDRPKLKFEPYWPVSAPGLDNVDPLKAEDFFARIREGDILLHHPYDSFASSVQAFITHAAHDPQVLAIKQTLYRTSGDSPIVKALIEAAQAGKQVVAIVEIKARFDEEANIEWARKLERAGAHVVYGMVGLKTHCKLALVVRQEADGMRRYCHVGTGNYHPKTARGYEDLGLLTVDRQVAQDLSRLFNQLSGYAPSATFYRLLVAPLSIRDGLLERIEGQIARREEGKDAWIGIKVNSIVDERIIDALYRASSAGVHVDVLVRGICAIRAGIAGLSENIRVRSILGRYLEHSRIYAFGPPGEEEVWIGSADLMHRNLDRRVEALIRIVDGDQVRFLSSLIRRGVSDTVASWSMEADGTWKRHATGEDGQRLMDLQVELMNEAIARSGR